MSSDPRAPLKVPSEEAMEAIQPDQPMPSIENDLRMEDRPDLLNESDSSSSNQANSPLRTLDMRGRENLSTEDSLTRPMSLQVYQPPEDFESVTASGQWNIARLFGPRRPFPAHLQAQLEEWHCEHPETYPPSSTRVIAVQTWKLSVIFDFDGNEHDASAFTIIYKGLHPDAKTIQYIVVVYHSENAPDLLVAVAQKPTKSVSKENWHASFLVGWLGPQEQFQTHICAARVSKLREDGPDIKFHASILDSFTKPYMPGYHAYLLSGYSPGGSIQSPVGSPQQGVLAIEIPSSATSSTPRNIMNEEDPRTPPNRSIHVESDIEMGIGSSESQGCLGAAMSPDNSGHEKDAKHDSASQENLKAMIENPALRFRLLTYHSDEALQFPAKGCTLEKLFRKANRFYAGMGDGRDPRLLCKLPGKKLLFYLEQDSEEEFELLCHDLSKFSLNDDEDPVIEVYLKQNQPKVVMQAGRQKMLQFNPSVIDD